MLVNTSIVQSAISLLKDLISLPSFSREEGQVAIRMADYFQRWSIPYESHGYNLWASTPNPDGQLPVILLNSHLDTVKPVAGWTRSPFTPSVEDGKLFGLGSNDAGGPLVSLLATFTHLFQQGNLPFQLIFAATAEEEISGKQGIASLLPLLPPIDLGIVGEPTQMELAVAEKGLMVVDAQCRGKAGHAAREEGENALYLALEDIQYLRELQLPIQSPTLGPVRFSVTQIQAGQQHNVVPDRCDYVIDIRSNGAYSNREIFQTLQNHLRAELKARSFRLNSSQIASDHPLVQKAKAIGIPCFGSTTLSDQALMDFPTVKIGPGDSARSHTADEYIYLHEIEASVPLYLKLLDQLQLNTNTTIKNQQSWV